MIERTPRFPVYIPSKSRPGRKCLTARYFEEDGVDFRLVVEPSEADAYREDFGDRVLVLPADDFKLMNARNWIWEHSREGGHERHWVFDDNIRGVRRVNRGKRIRCNANLAMAAIEDFTCRYTNIAISGMNYTMFVPSDAQRPFVVNCHVYSAMLLNGSIPFRFRLIYNDDTDLCLQVLTNELCTVLFNAFTVDKAGTMTCTGGNTEQLYGGVQKDPQSRATRQRLMMARALEEVWPDHVEVKWRFGRAQHVVKNSWKDFTHPLIRRSDIDWSEFEKVDNRGMKLRAVNGKPKSQELRELLVESYEAEERVLETMTDTSGK